MKNRLPLFLFISAAIHSLALLLLSPRGHRVNQAQPSWIPIQIEMKETPAQKKHQIVELKNFNHRKPQSTAYLSHHNNTTKTEVKGKLGQSFAQSQQKKQGDASGGSVKIHNFLHSFNGRIDYLEGVKPGDETQLNTHETLFYTFHLRVRRQIYWHWLRQLRVLLGNKKVRPQPFPLIVRIEALLDEKGRLQSLILRKKSGLEELDQASAMAIQLAHPFPNPPQEMVSEDGKLHLHYAFALEGV